MLVAWQCERGQTAVRLWPRGKADRDDRGARLSVGLLSLGLVACVACAPEEPKGLTDAGAAALADAALADAGDVDVGDAVVADAGVADVGVADAGPRTDGGAPSSGAPVWAADVVVDAVRRDDAFGDPSLAVNGVRGGGERAGSVDVYSLSPSGPGSSIVLRWSGRRVVDGPGVDLVVFENPFRFSGGVFMDLVIVEVSADGEAWVAFPHDYVAEDEGSFSADPEHWLGFAGRVPVTFDSTEGGDPFEEDAGGDRFDLSDLPPGAATERAMSEGVRYLRLLAATSRDNPNTGVPFVSSPLSDGPDIDGVAGRYLEVE